MRWVPLALSMILANATLALAADVERSVEIARPPAEVWAMTGPFCAIQTWHPDVEGCETMTISGKPHRRLKLKTGEAFLEREMERDDTGMAYRYTIERGPLPLARYRATFSVEPAGSGSRVTWKSDFEADREREVTLATALGEMYETGLNGLKAKLER